MTTNAAGVGAEPARRLPVTTRLVTAETIGSFLSRLAKDNGLRTKTLLRQVEPALNRRQTTPVTDSMSHWQPTHLTRLADLSGHRLDRLAMAIPAVADAHADRQQPAASGVIRACSRCIAAKGVTGTVYRRARPHEHLCPRHHRWLRTHDGTDLSPTPEILTAQRQLDLLASRHHDADIAHAITSAHAVLSAWLAEPWHPTLTQRWEQRQAILLGPPPHRPGMRNAILSAATHPEAVAIASTLLSTAVGADPDHGLSGLAITLDLPERRPPGARDPLRRRMTTFKIHH